MLATVVATVSCGRPGGGSPTVGPAAVGPAVTPFPTRTRPPAPGIDEELEAQEGPSQPLAPRPLKSGAKPVAYLFKQVDRATAARVSGVRGTSAGAPLTVTYLRAYRGGTDVADLAVFGFARDVATRPAFQAQVVAQLVQQASGSRSVVREQVIGRPLVLAGGSRPAAAWFGEAAVLVRPPGTGSAGLAAARAVIYAYALNPHPS